MDNKQQEQTGNTSALDGRHFDTVIIGAGMSGLAAGIRLAMFERSVIVLERHTAPGGLNSFYRLDKRDYDVGLHAMTNYVAPGVKGTPLGKLLRQLRIPRDEFALCEQMGSRCVFGDVSLSFSNDYALLESEVARVFPAQIDAFRKLVAHIREFNDTALDNREQSAKAVISDYLSDPLLVDMVMLPLMYYGSAQEDDMDFSQFVIMFKSIYLEGFARPFEGVRRIIKALLKKYKTLGGERKMGVGVRKMVTDSARVTSLELDNGAVISADHVVSSAGWGETLDLLEGELAEREQKVRQDNIGQLSFTETITMLKSQPQSFGWEDTIIFFNEGERFCYRQPDELVDPRSGVICLPNNYRYDEGQQLSEGILRVTAMANYERWCQLPEAEYRARKEYWYRELQQQALRFLPGQVSTEGLSADTVATDMFTPRTITKYTGHLAGAIYGAPHKARDGSTHLENLYLCGTDQGFLGIVGAMLSGISMANYHILGK